MNNIKKILIPGSFDPVTVGHYDVIERCSRMYDEVVVAVFENTEKKGKGVFSGEDCKKMLEIAVEGLPNVKVGITNKLVVDYADEVGAKLIVKGVRDTIDFEYEYGLFAINRTIGKYDTLFVPSLPEYKHISSTFVREMIKYGRDITPYVPKGVADYIKDKIKKQ